MLAWGYAECSLCDLCSEYLIFSLLFDVSLFPLIRKFLTACDAAHPLLYPIVRIALGLIQSPCSFRCQFRVFDLLHPLIAYFCQPAFEGLCFGGGDGLDKPEYPLRIPTIHLLFSANSFHLQHKGWYKLYPPFISKFCQFLI